MYQVNQASIPPLVTGGDVQPTTPADANPAVPAVASRLPGTIPSLPSSGSSYSTTSSPPARGVPDPMTNGAATDNADWIRYSAPSKSALSCPDADWKTGPVAGPVGRLKSSGVRATATRPLTAVRRWFTSGSIWTSHRAAEGNTLRRSRNSTATVAARSASAAPVQASSNAATAPGTVPAAFICKTRRCNTALGIDVAMP